MLTWNNARGALLCKKLCAHPFSLSQGIFKVVLAFLPKKLKERIIFSGQNWKEIHQQVFPPDQLPTEMGGTQGVWERWPQDMVEGVGSFSNCNTRNVLYTRTRTWA